MAYYFFSSYVLPQLWFYLGGTALAECHVKKIGKGDNK